MTPDVMKLVLLVTAAAAQQVPTKPYQFGSGGGIRCKVAGEVVSIGQDQVASLDWSPKGGSGATCTDPSRDAVFGEFRLTAGRHNNQFVVPCNYNPVPTAQHINCCWGHTRYLSDVKRNVWTQCVQA